MRRFFKKGQPLRGALCSAPTERSVDGAFRCPPKVSSHRVSFSAPRESKPVSPLRFATAVQISFELERRSA